MASNLSLQAVITADDRASGTIKGMGENINKQVTKIGAGMAAVGAGLTLLTKNSVDFTKDLVSNTKMIQRETGATAKEASGLLYVTNRLGISADQASTTFGIFSKNIKEASGQTGLSALELQKLQNQMDKTKLEIRLTEKAIKDNGDETGELSLKVRTLKTELTGLEEQTKGSSGTFKKLGLEIKNADGSTKSFNQILLETADRFKTMRAGAEKTALALELFGRSGKDMIKVLDLGSKGIQELERNAEKLGLTIDQKNIVQVTRFIRAQKDLKDTTNALRVQIGLLTTPILTAFTQKITEVAGKIILADGPFQKLLAHVIAFGGPIATAGGGLIAFGANLSQVMGAVIGLGLGLRALVAFMTGPLGLIIAGITTLAGILTAQWFTQTNQTQSLKAAQEALKVSTDSLRDSELALAGANLSVESAQRSYNESVRQFGPSSLEARQALHNLQVAQDQAKDAAKRHHAALEDLKKKEKEVAKEKALILHLNEVRDNLRGVGRDAFDAGQKIDLINGKRITVKTSKDKRTGQEQVDFVSTFGRRAKGGPVTAGQAYMVGEEGPEVYVPNRSGEIIPNNKLTTGGGSTTINMNVNVGMYAGSELEKRQVAQSLFQALRDVASSQNMTLEQMMR